MKFFTITLCEFLLYSLNIIQICPSSYPQPHIYNNDFWDDYFDVDYTRVLKELFE